MASRERFILFSCLASLSCCEMLQLPVGSQFCPRVQSTHLQVLVLGGQTSATEGEGKVGVTREAAVSLPYLSVHDCPCSAAPTPMSFSLPYHFGK